MISDSRGMKGSAMRVFWRELLYAGILAITAFMGCQNANKAGFSSESVVPSLEGSVHLTGQLADDGSPTDILTGEPTSLPTLSALPTELSLPTEMETENGAKENGTMLLTIGEFKFTIVLEDNESAAALKEKLPLELAMSELNGNEKYNYLPFTLPTNPHSPGMIHAGDVMLYGNNCLVVFYVSFSSAYSYTKIGYIEDAENLQNAVGTGGVRMIFGE